MIHYFRNVSRGCSLASTISCYIVLYSNVFRWSQHTLRLTYFLFSKSAKYYELKWLNSFIMIDSIIFPSRISIIDWTLKSCLVEYIIKHNSYRSWLLATLFLSLSLSLFICSYICPSICLFFSFNVFHCITLDLFYLLVHILWFYSYHIEFLIEFCIFHFNLFFSFVKLNY